MGDVAYQLLILLFSQNLLIRGFLQPKPHVFIIPVHLSVLLGGKHILEISLRNVLHGYIKLVDRIKNALCNPLGQEQTGKKQDHHDGNRHIHEQLPGNQGIRPCYDKEAALASVPEIKIHMTDLLFHVVKVNTLGDLRINIILLKIRKSVEDLA